MLRLTLLLVTLFFCQPGLADNRFISLCYHDVKDEWDDNPMTVTTENLISHFSWLKEHGYHPVSVQDILDAKAGKFRLPEKAVLLSFDDGYKNFYHKIYPALKLFNYPAVFGVVTSWLQVAEGESVQYGDQQKAREDFLSWTQIREMMNSGLIEIASHSHDLHRGLQGNPQGNSQPAAITRQYFPATGLYENDFHYLQRVRDDLKRSADILQQYTGKRPRVMVWPYGAYSRETQAIARQQGMTLSLALDSKINAVEAVDVITRHLVIDNPDINHYIYSMHHLEDQQPIRVAHVDLDYIYDPNPEQINANLSKLLDRIKQMRINTVYLQAFSDPDGDGNTDALYFPNRHMPVKADLFNRIAWQLKTRAQVNVYAWLPVLSFQSDVPEDWWVYENKNGNIIKSTNNYQRLSPFHPDARRWVGEIYQDLAKTSHFSGILFHDDAFLTDFEDFSPYAVTQLKSLPPAQQLDKKITALSDFTHYLAEQVRFYRPEIKTARNMYANVVMQPVSSEWFAQTLQNFLDNYDYVALMAMPYIENAEHPESWLKELIAKVAAHPDALQKTVFELQTVDWRTQQKIPNDTLRTHLQILQRHNVMNYGYYPDDFHIDSPSLSMLKEMMTLETFPYGI